MLCNMSYWALELHGSVATWPSLSCYALNMSYWAPELHGSVATWLSKLFCLFEQLSCETPRKS